MSPKIFRLRFPHLIHWTGTEKTNQKNLVLPSAVGFIFFIGAICPPHPLYLSYLSNKLICDFYIIFVKRQYLKKKLVVAFLFDLSGTFCPVFMQIFNCNKLYVPLSTFSSKIGGGKALQGLLSRLTKCQFRVLLLLKERREDGGWLQLMGEFFKICSNPPMAGLRL